MKKSLSLFILTVFISFFLLTCGGGGGPGGAAPVEPSGPGPSGQYVLEYEASTYNHNGTNSYLTVYGWTRRPLVEFYIVESFGVYRPPGIAPSDPRRKGTITVDGATYDIYHTSRTGPNIDGNGPFQQYYSVRRNAGRRTSGTVSVSKHFDEWKKLGMELGSLYEIALCVEAYAGSSERAHGNATIAKNIFKIDGVPISTTGGGSNPGSITSNINGQRFNGYNYEFWTDATSSGGSMNLTATGNGGTFTCSWDSDSATKQSSNTYNILFRMGRRFP